MQADNHTLALAQHLADAAGDIIRRYWRMPGAVDRKADATPVTRADREAEAAMRALIEAHFPAHGIIGEELGNAREGAEYQWVLDPIDGTRAFIAGYPIFTTLIALAKDGVPILGIIDQPIMRERWTGIAGEKSTLNGKIISTRDCRSLEHAAIATTSAPYYFSASEAAAFERVRRQCAQTIVGGDGYGYAMLASGHIDVFIDSCLKPYDFCAHKPIIEGAGGVITDWDGKPLTIKSDGRVIAAANAELHKEALKICREIEGDILTNWKGDNVTIAPDGNIIACTSQELHKEALKVYKGIIMGFLDQGGRFDETEAFFKKDADGKVVFYPWLFAGRGYVIEAEEKEKQLRKIIRKFNIFMLISLFLMPHSFYILFFPVAAIGLIYFTKYLTRDCPIREVLKQKTPNERQSAIKEQLESYKKTQWWYGTKLDSDPGIFQFIILDFFCFIAIAFGIICLCDHTSKPLVALSIIGIGLFFGFGISRVIWGKLKK